MSYVQQLERACLAFKVTKYSQKWLYINDNKLPALVINPDNTYAVLSFDHLGRLIGRYYDNGQEDTYYYPTLACPSVLVVPEFVDYELLYLPEKTLTGQTFHNL